MPAGSDHGSADRQGDVAILGEHARQAFLATADTIGEGRGIVGFVPGLVLPAVIELVGAGLAAADEGMGSAPLSFDAAVLADDDIAVAEVFCRVWQVDGDRPVGVTLDSHPDRLLLVAGAESGDIADDIYRLTPVGMIIDIECYFHSIYVFITFTNSHLWPHRKQV